MRIYPQTNWSVTVENKIIWKKGISAATKETTIH